jgi:predicted small lipoprotein YifL
MSYRVVAAASLLLLAACGQKGPLYLPDKNPTPVAAAPASAPAPAPAPSADPAAKKKADDADEDTAAPK